MKIPPNLKGFTLIEVVVASALLLIASVAGIAAYRDYSDSQKLQNAALDLSVTFQKAKSRAQTQLKPADITACTTSPLGGYEVRICGVPLSSCAQAGEYELHIICGSTNTLIETKKLPLDITFTNSSNPVFLFKVMQGSVNSGTVVLESNGKQKTIQVSGLGNITVN